jgi:chromosome segregation ATPase
MNIIEILTFSLYSVIAFFVGKEFFLPQLNKLYKWLKKEKNETEDRTFDVGQEVHKMKMNENEYYEETFNTLLGQISSLEDQLKEYAKELSALRSEILQLNAKLYNKAMVIVELQKKCCARAEFCPNREFCENSIKKLDEDN